MLANLSCAYLLGIATMPLYRFIAGLFREEMEPDWDLPEDGSRGTGRE